MIIVASSCWCSRSLVIMSGALASAIIGEALFRDGVNATRAANCSNSTTERRPAMHRQDASIEVLTQAIARYSIGRLRMDPPPLDKPRTPADLRAMAGRTITPDGIGGLEALRIYGDVLGPACISVDHPRFLSFVPAAPTEASILFDLVVGASSVYAGSWLEGAGAIFAENEALRWIADLVGLPDGAGGVFVSGGTAGNLSALIAARWHWRHRADGAHDRTRGLIVASSGCALLGGPGRAGDGRRRRPRACRRARSAHRIGAA